MRARMVAAYPEQYPWSSFRFNSLGVANEWQSPHLEYIKLRRDNGVRQLAYLDLFDKNISKHFLSKISEAMNKAWITR